jgi:hypothetical protein
MAHHLTRAAVALGLPLPVLAPEPGDLTPREARLKQWLALWDAGGDVFAALDDALARGEAIPADPADAAEWAAAL